LLPRRGPQNRNVVTHNPVKDVKRPRSESGEGKTPAVGGDLLAAVVI
jgi:hypothetical protein